VRRHTSPSAKTRKTMKSVEDGFSSDVNCLSWPQLGVDV
jgi:hypothetical protein